MWDSAHSSWTPQLLCGDESPWKDRASLPFLLTYALAGPGEAAKLGPLTFQHPLVTPQTSGIPGGPVSQERRCHQMCLALAPRESEPSESRGGQAKLAGLGVRPRILLLLHGFLTCPSNKVLPPERRKPRLQQRDSSNQPTLEGEVTARTLPEASSDFLNTCWVASGTLSH